MVIHRLTFFLCDLSLKAKKRVLESCNELAGCMHMLCMHVWYLTIILSLDLPDKLYAISYYHSFLGSDIYFSKEES